ADGAARPAPALPAALSRAVCRRAAAGPPACRRQGGLRARPQRRMLPVAHQLRVRRAGDADLRGTAGGLRDRLRERARRLDPGDGAAGLGFGFMPEHSARHPGVVALPLIEPEFWREVALVTVRGRPHSAAAGSLVREAMRKRWNGKPALAIAAMQGASAAKAPARRPRAVA